MPNQPLPASPYIGYFLPSNSRDKGEELKAPLSLYCSHFSHQLLSLSHLAYSYPESALPALRIPITRIPHLLSSS